MKQGKRSLKKAAATAGGARAAAGKLASGALGKIGGVLGDGSSTSLSPHALNQVLDAVGDMIRESCVDADMPAQAISCNCSHCHDKGFLLAFTSCGLVCFCNVYYQETPYHTLPIDALTAYVHVPIAHAWLSWRRMTNDVKRHNQDLLESLLRVWAHSHLTLHTQ